jgi:glycosyltransferase 2 family protein
MKLIRAYARPALVVALVAACVLALIASWSDVTDALPRVGWTRFAVSTALAMIAGIGLAVGWRILLADLVVFDEHHPSPAVPDGTAGTDERDIETDGESGADGPAIVVPVRRELRHHVGLSESVGVYSASQLGKYIPGSVWPVVAQMSLSRRHGIARRSILAAFVTQMLLLVVTAVLVAAVTLPWVDADQLRSHWWLLVIAPAICLVLVPGVQRRILAAVGRLLRRDLAIPTPGHRAMLATIAVSALTYVFFGLHLSVMAWPLIEDPSVSAVVQCTGAFALAWAAGFVVVFAPAGLGVRELVLTLTLSSLLASSDATALAVLSRTSLVIADLALGLYGVAILGAGRKLASAKQDQDVGGGLALAGLDVGDEAEHEDLRGHQQQY